MASTDCEQKILELAEANGIEIHFMGGGVSKQIFIKDQWDAESHIHITLMAMVLQ